MKTWLYGAALFGMAAFSLLSVPTIASQAAEGIAKSPSIAQAPARPRPTEEFIVRGNEPFWSVTIGKRGIVYTTPDTKPQTFPYVAPLAAQGRPTDLVRVYRLQGTGNNLLILKKTPACSDTMSDRKYPYSATLILGNTVREGCAERKP